VGVAVGGFPPASARAETLAPELNNVKLTNTKTIARTRYRKRVFIVVFSFFGLRFKTGQVFDALASTRKLLSLPERLLKMRASRRWRRDFDKQEMGKNGGTEGGRNLVGRSGWLEIQ
jgi:hypothetical protein